MKLLFKPFIPKDHYNPGGRKFPEDSVKEGTDRKKLNTAVTREVPRAPAFPHSLSKHRLWVPAAHSPPLPK